MDSELHPIEDRLAALSAAVVAVVRPAPAARVRARGDRRRIRLISGLGVAAAVFAILVAISALLVPGAGTGNVGPAGPALRIPAQFQLSHDGQAGWTRVGGADQPAIFQPCPERDPTRDQRTDAITAQGPGAAFDGRPAVGTASEQLLLFQDSDASAAAVVFLANNMRACGWNTVASVYDSAGDYDPDVLGASRVIPASGSAPAEYEGATVLRRGNALWITAVRIPGTDHGLSEVGPIDVRRELCVLLRLCFP